MTNENKELKLCDAPENLRSMVTTKYSSEIKRLDPLSDHDIASEISRSNTLDRLGVFPNNPRSRLLNQIVGAAGASVLIERAGLRSIVVQNMCPGCRGKPTCLRFLNWKDRLNDWGRWSSFPGIYDTENIDPAPENGSDVGEDRNWWPYQNPNKPQPCASPEFFDHILQKLNLDQGPDSFETYDREI